MYDGTPEVVVEEVLRVTGTVYKSFALGRAEERSGVDHNDAALRPFGGEPYIAARDISLTVTGENDLP